jgi:hypothetical protein
LTSPIEPDDPLAAVAAQQAALSAATWTPVSAVPGVSSAPVLGLTAVRRTSGSGPVLWFSPTEWGAFLEGDVDVAGVLTALAAAP